MQASEEHSCVKAETEQLITLGLGRGPWHVMITLGLGRGLWHVMITLGIGRGLWHVIITRL